MSLGNSANEIAANSFGSAAGLEAASAQMVDLYPDRIEQLRRKWVQQAMGYDFRTRDLLNRAFTHDLGSPHFNLERLEFLGDVVAGSCAVTTLLLSNVGNQLNHKAGRSSRLVSNQALADRAEDLGFNFELVGPRDREIAAPNWPFPSQKAKADVIEALLGAIFFDSGYSSALLATQNFIGQDLFVKETGVTPQFKRMPGSGQVRDQMPTLALPMANWRALEAAELNLGDEFGNPRALYNALCFNSSQKSHPSRAHKTLQVMGRACYVLNLSENLLKAFPEYDPTLLSGARALFLSRDRMAQHASDLGIADLLCAWTRAQLPRQRLLADGFEAVVGAIFIDGGYRAAARFLAPRILPALGQFADVEELRAQLGAGLANRATFIIERP